MTIFNRGVRGKRSADGTNIGGISNSFVENKYPVPTIDSWTISGSDDDALDPAGGQTVLVNGGGFVAGCAVTVDGSTISPVTLVSPNQISFTSPAKAGGSYTLIVYNSAGGAAILVPGLIYSSVPTWTTSAGSIGSYYETTAIDETLVATSDSAITYTLASGSLPSGSTLYANGVITGTAPVDSSSTTYTFAVTATDAEDQDVTRTFTLTINTDVVTWVTPSSGATITLDGTAYSQALSATDAAGYSIASYTANALPTGLTLTSGTISGTPTVEGSTTTLLTATAATTGRSATNTVTWVVALNDTYWKYNTILLSANAAVQTNSFVSDNSINNALITVVGDTRASNFNPYQLGFYSVHFDGTGQDFRNSSFTGANFGTSNNFTIEMWVYWFTTAGGNETIFELSGTTRIIIGRSTSGVRIYNNNTEKGFSATVRPGMWNHIAMVRNSGTISIYLNGVSGTSYADTTNWTHTTFYTSKNSDGSEVSASFYLSNLRILNGTAAYTTTFTPSTTPLSLTPTTTLLLAYSNRFSDFSNQNITLTVDGTPKVITNNPFTTVYQAGTQYYSTYFNGSTDYLTIADNAAFEMTGDFTVEAWFYLTAVPGPGLFGDIVTKGAAGIYQPYYLFINSSSTLLFYSSSTGSGWDVASAQSLGTISLNTWYHVAVSRQGTALRLFLNGSLINTITNGNALYDNTRAVAIGGRSDGTETAFTGNISNVRIVKGTAVYTSAFTPPTSPLTAISGTSLLTCQDSTFKDNSTNNFTITVGSTTVKPLAVSPFTSNSYSSTQITTYGSGYFDGTGDYLTLASSPAFAFGTGNFTIEGWAYMIGINGTANGIFQQGTSFPINATTNTVAFGTVSTGQVWQIYANGTNTNSTATWIQNNWYHFAVVRNSTTTTLYINGVAVITVTGDSTNYTGTYFGIGALYSTSYSQNGYISDLRVVKGTAVYTSNFVPGFTSPLTNITNTQLLTLQTNGNHNNSGFIDKSGFSNIITRSGNATNGTFSPYGDNFSVYFGGSDAFSTGASSALTIPTSSTPFTLELWVNITQNSTQQCFFTEIWPGGGNINFCFLLNNGSSFDSDGGYPSFGYYNGSWSGTFSTTVVPLNTWTHLAFVFTGSTSKIYMNGTDITKGTPTPVSSWGITGTGNDGYYIAQRWDTLNKVNGYISNLRFVVGTAVYTSAFTAPVAALAPITNTKFLTCNTNRFIDNSVTNLALTNVGSPKVQNFSPFSAITVTKYYSTYFNGSSDYLTVGGTTGFNINSAGSYTIEAWIYATGGSGTRRVISSKDHYSGTTYPSFSWYIENTNVMTFSIGTGTTSGTGAQAMTGTVTISLNTWYHVAFVASGSTWYMFVNGTLDATGSITGTVGYSTGAIIVGAAANGVYHNGYISNLRITKSAVYTSAFTPSTIPLTTTSQSVSSANVSLLTCQNNTLIDNSTNYYTITGIATVKVLPVSPFTPPTPGTAITYSPTIFGGSMYFDGTGDKLTIANYPGLSFRANDFTIQCWFWTNTTTSGVDQVIMTNGWASYAPWLLRINSSNQAMLNMSLNGGSWYVSEQPLGTVTLGQWYHLAVTRSSGVLRAFLNGIQSYTTDLTTNSLYDGSQALNVGGRSDTSVPLNGYIADAQLINGVGIYSANFYPGSTPATPNGTLGTTKYTSTLLLNGTSGGVINATRTIDLETVGDAKVAQFSPYNGNYYSVQFAGSTTDLLSVPSASWSTFAGQFTLECWVRFNNSTYTGNLFGTQNSGALCLYYNVSSWNVNNFGSGDIINTGWNPTAGVWYHIAITRNSSNLMSFWVNGVQSGSATTSSTYTQNFFYLNNFGSTGMNFNLCDFRVISGQCLFTGSFTPSTSPLTTTTVGHTGANVASSITGTVNVLLCQSNKFIDNSSNAYTVSPSGSPKVQTQNPFQINSGQSYYFDGTGDSLYAVSSPNFTFGTGDFTIEFWLYFNATANRQDIMWISTTGAATDRLGISWNLTSGNLTYYISPTIGNAINYAWTPTAGQWYHIALARSSGSTKLFVNGTQGGSTYSDSRNYNSQYAVYVGQDSTGLTSPFNGYLSDIRITRGYARYTTTFTPPTTPYKLN